MSLRAFAASTIVQSRPRSRSLVTNCYESRGGDLQLATLLGIERHGDFGWSPNPCPMVTGVLPHVGGPIALGCPTVLVGNMPAARLGDSTAHGGTIVIGYPTLLAGG